MLNDFYKAADVGTGVRVYNSAVVGVDRTATVESKVQLVQELV